LSDGYHSLVDVGPGPVTGSWAASDADDTAETGPTRYWVPVRAASHGAMHHKDCPHCVE
jgi:hypothetical protein